MSKYQVTYVLKDVKHTVLVNAETGAEASDVVKSQVSKRVKMVDIKRCDESSKLDFIKDLEYLT